MDCAIATGCSRAVWSVNVDSSRVPIIYRLSKDRIDRELLALSMLLAHLPEEEQGRTANRYILARLIVMPVIKVILWALVLIALKYRLL